MVVGGGLAPPGSDGCGVGSGCTGIKSRHWPTLEAGSWDGPVAVESEQLPLQDLGQVKAAPQCQPIRTCGATGAHCRAGAAGFLYHGGLRVGGTKQQLLVGARSAPRGPRLPLSGWQVPGAAGRKERGAWLPRASR